MTVPPALRRWFMLHAVADVAFAMPLPAAPAAFLAAPGWPAVDPAASRLVAAALFGIGIESWRMHDGGVEADRTMLDLKIVWSAAATVGLLWSFWTGSPTFTWAVLGIFVAFNAVRIRHRRHLGRR